jgi:uncharacterized protein YndB with AHSA1/START domain
MNTMNKHEEAKGSSTSVSRLIKAPRERVYQAFMNGEAVTAWLAPDTMKATVHTFEPREGGLIHISLTYQSIAESPDGKGGKSSADSDTFKGKFAEIIPNEKIVWLTEFDSTEPEFAGEMKLTWSFVDAGGETEVTVLCENIPRGIRPEDNEAGSRSTLQKLAAFVE